MTAPVQRVIVYVDGFNLYYGLKSKGWRSYLWLDLHELARRLLKAGQSLVAVKYFTATVHPEPSDPDKPKRQRTYLEALGTLPNLTIHLGAFLNKSRTCSACGHVSESYEEKMTDVNMAVELLSDAQDDEYDVAILVSADSDLAGPIEAVRTRFPRKKVVVAFPPGRASKHLKRLLSAHTSISQVALRNSQFPVNVVKPDGYVLTRPPSWR